MTEVQTNAAVRELIAFRIGEQEILSSTSCRCARSALDPRHPAAPGPRLMKGVINLRGAVLPIVDLGARFGLSTSDPTARHVIMVAHIGGRTVGLLVDAVSDIIQLTDGAVQPTPDVASDDVRTFVKGIFALEGRMISLIELDMILPETEAEAA